jgi:alpha-beta hydrolase superfamily lysophospholipase
MVIGDLAARTADGVTLRIDHVRASAPRRGSVVCLHAMMTDGRYFGARRGSGSFAHALATAGLDVFVADFRGHGRSTPPRAGPGDWSFDDLVELDLPAIIVACARASGIAPGELAVLGHSLGGLVACAALGTGRIPPPRLLVLAATSVWLGETLARRAIMGVYAASARLLGRAPIRALRLGTADESHGYVDQLTGWARRGRWDSRAGIDYMAALAAIDVPTFAYSGAGDWMCRPRDARAIAGRIRTCDPLRIVGRQHGDPIDPDHFQLFTRPELAHLHADLAARIAR